MPLPTDNDGAIDWTAATVQASQQSRAEEVRNSVSQALPVNPDTEAQLRRDASAARIPLPAARALPDATKVQAQMSQFDADIIARKFPSTAQLLANPDLAKITHDDIPKTTQIEQHVTALAGKGFMGPPEPTLLERAKTIDFWTGAAKYIFSANEGKDNLTSDIGSAATALSGKIGEGAALAGAGALTVVGAGGTKAQDAVFGVAKQYGDQAEAENAAPQAFHNKLVKSAATLGLQLPMMMAGGAGGQLLEAGATGTATLMKYLGDAAVHGAKAMSVPATTDAIDMMHKVYAKTGDMGAAARAGQAQYLASTAGGVVPLNAPGGLAARMLGGAAAGTVQGELSRQGMNAVLPDSMQTPFSLEDAAVSGTVGSLTAGVMGPRPETNRNAAVRAFNDAYSAALGEHRNEQIVNLGKAAAQSKLRERDPAAFHQFIQDTVNQGDAPKGLFIDAHQLASVLEAHGITGDELHQTMPDVAAQLEHATGDTAPSNGLVQIPIADFATHIAGSPLEEPLLQHLRVDPEGGTVAESKAYHQSQVADLAKQAERLTATHADDVAYQASLDKVHTDLHSRLQAIGMTPEIAAANSAPLAAFYQVHADRLGILPHEMAERYPVNFGNKALDGTIATHGQAAEDVLRTVGGGDSAPGWSRATSSLGTSSGRAALYRGASRELSPEHFGLDALGKASGKGAAGLGVFFTKDRREAARHGDVESFHVDLRNPKIIDVDKLPGFDTPADAYAYSRKLEAEGYDGIVLRSEHVGGVDHTIAFRPDQVIYPKPAAGEATFAQSLSTRVPTTKKNPENALGEMPLFADLATMQTEPEKLAQNVALLERYPGVHLTGTDAEKLAQFVEHVKNNLLFLHDSVDPDTRARSKLWYDGARKIVDKWAPHYGISDMQMSGMLAVLSPQKDWFMNVSLAKRVADAMHDHQDTRWDDKMTETASRIFAKDQYATYLAAVKGKTLGEITHADPDVANTQRAMWIRAHDETHNDRGHQIVSPEGEFTGPRRNANGAETKTGWGSLGEIAKAISIYLDGSAANVSDQLGGMHKVRNFYNNIFNPKSEHGYATIDTHAVAAGLLRPLSGSSPEVLHNFGSNEKGVPGPASSAKTGLSGTYAIFHEAYKLAAAERGILPREMQSITWEAVRGLFKDTFKSQKGNLDAIDKIWSDYKAGTLTLDEARAAVVERAGGISDPEWLGPDSRQPEGSRPAADAQGVPGVQLPGRRADDVAGRAGSKPAEGAEGLDRFAGESPAFHQARGLPDALPPGQVGHTLVNIGLDIPGGGHLSANEAMRVLREAGVDVRGNSVHQSDTEQTLVAELSRPLTEAEGHAVSVALRQEAIAQMTGDTGAMFGPEKDKWGAFNPEYFLKLDGARAAFAQESRGTFSPTTKTITQLKGADLSTFQHELGHFFLDTLAHMASDPNAPASVKADMATLLRWGDVPDLESWHRMSMDEQRALHEKFATGWETYLMRGEAPSLEMRSLFSRFRAWMLNVYKTLKGAPGEYTPEVRGVFDRMIASEDAIAQAEQARRYMPLFDTPEKSAMTPEEWSAYQALGKDATEQAVEALTGKTLKDMAWMDRLRTASLKAVTKDAAEKRAAIVNEVKAEVMAQPIYRAWSFLTARKGEAADAADATTGAGKLNRDALKAAFGEEVANKLYELKMTGKKGIEPSVVADMFGFPDAASLVKALVESEPPKSVVEGMADQRMLERHGEIADPQAMQRTADELVHNEVRARFVATEFKALKKATGSARDIANAAKEAANNAIDTRRIRDISAAQYDAAETRSAKAAEAAMAKGDTAGAAAAKRDQILSMQLARAARDAQEYVEKAVTYLKKFDTPSTREAIDLEYRDQIDALLDRADLRKSVTNKSLDRREALQAFVERLSGEGYKPQIPESLLDEAQRWHYKDMPLAAFKGLVDSIKSIEHLGKLKSKLLDGQETREIQALADDVQATAAELPQQKAESNRGLSRIDKAWIATKAFGRSAQASMLKMEQMLDWLDARNPNGVLNRVVFRRIADAGTHEAEMLKAVKSQIGALVDSHLADITKERGKIYVADGLIDGATGLPQRFTTKEMLMLAGNMGNESNAAKMAKGEKWDQAEVWAFLHQNMTKAHWDFVAGLGRTLESLWPEKLAMDRRLGNTSPEKIQPRPFDTPHGSYEGWYWPLMYDPARAQDVAERGAKQGDAMFENIYAKANTDTGRMNTRNENYARPLLLDLDALPRMIKDEIHDVAYREAIIDADRFLSHPTVRKAIVSALSQEHYDQLRPWLQSIANDGKTSTDGARGMEFFNTIAREARTRATMVGLGLRLTTALVHGSTAATESVSELGAKWMASGLKDFANPGQWAANKDFVFARSGEMRNRMNEVDRDVRENLREIDLHMMDPTTSALQRGADVMRAHAYSLIAGLDMASALPTWMGAYKKALTPEDRGGLGYSEQDAIYFADKTVRNAHGGTGIKDMARVQRGTEFQKLFTMFYTFWNHNINRIIDTNKLVSSPEHRAMLKEQNNWSTTQLASTVILRTLAYTFGVQAIHSLISAPAKKDDDSEHWAAWAAKEFTAAAFAGIPIARDISAHYLTGRDYSVTPAASMVDAVGKSGQDAMNVLTGKSVSDKWLKHAITTTGYATSLPLGQPASTAQFLWDLGAGKTHPSTAKEWWAGVAHGDIHAHH